jgi:protein O-mannosyl-transferase
MHKLLKFLSHSFPQPLEHSVPALWSRRFLALATTEALKPWLPWILVVAVFAAFLPTVSFQFLDYDDPLYITRNEHVFTGFSVANVRWAFSTFDGFHHPITWLSLMLDAQFFGRVPAGFHLTNLWLHVANALLLYKISIQLNQSVFKSLCIALLFALHPITVETVTWISERKGLLAALGFLLSFYFYLRFLATGEKSKYFAALGLFTASLLCKPSTAFLPILCFIAERVLPPESVAFLDS